MKFSYKKKLKIHDGWINDAVMSSRDGLIATCSTDTTVKVLKKDVLLKTIRTHKLAVNAVAFSDVNPLLVSVSDDRRVLCHDLVTMRIFRSLYGSYSSIRCVHIADNIIGVGDRSSAIIYDLRSSTIINTYNIGRVVNAITMIGTIVVIGSHSLYIVDERKNCSALCVNQNEIREIKRTRNGFAVLSAERIVDVCMDEPWKYTEIKSENAHFTGVQPVNDRFYFTMSNKIILGDKFVNETVEKTNKSVLAVLKETLNGVCVDNDEQMIVAYGESMHYLYRRDFKNV
ncbi:Pleiotropic regulator 1 [Trachipleistophora hominis]|uniref:Pleiotropic regulator 1 n=1 Tax=Trachipleistophora hominis TaxID=72359 RepID=L7JZV1_TRAHO|nr:Pleiotropic regulator 1 [Trachipleistophora hominis]